MRASSTGNEPAGFLGRIMGPLLDRQLSKGFAGFLEDLEKAAIA